MKNAVQFGAGNIGRGLMGQLFWEGGYKTTFIETNKEVVELINEKKKYSLKLLDAYSRKEIDITIENINSIKADNREGIAFAISRANIIGTAVGVKELEKIAPFIAAGVESRIIRNPKPIDIYLCENTLDASIILKKAVLSNLNSRFHRWTAENVGFVGMIVARMVPPPSNRFGIDDPLFATADSYHILPIDANNIRSDLPDIKGMEPVSNFKAEFERKLFTHNLAHAVMGYLGYLKNYTYVHEPFNDSFIKGIYDRVLDETTKAIINKYPQDIELEGQKEIRKDVEIRFSNPMIMDTVFRVARDPIRKLGQEDRLIGSAKLCMENNIFPKNIAYICGAAFNYDYPKDEIAQRLQEMIADKGIEKVIEEVSEIDNTSDFGKKIIEGYYDIREKRKEWVK
ncbi:MAG TPA: hypothetical protein DCP02_00075 [Actinobacteria bacterium]|nr:hypothetical protein [Actinomycetota bacterium]